MCRSQKAFKLPAVYGVRLKQVMLGGTSFGSCRRSGGMTEPAELARRAGFRISFIVTTPPEIFISGPSRRTASGFERAGLEGELSSSRRLSQHPLLPPGGGAPAAAEVCCCC